MIRFSTRLIFAAAFVGSSLTAFATNGPTALDGVVMPKRPVIECIRDGMQFLKKGDDGYVPGTANGKLAGYLTTAYETRMARGPNGFWPLQAGSMRTLFSRSSPIVTIPVRRSGYRARRTLQIGTLRTQHPQTPFIRIFRTRLLAMGTLVVPRTRTALNRTRRRSWAAPILRFTRKRMRANTLKPPNI